MNQQNYPYYNHSALSQGYTPNGQMQPAHQQGQTQSGQMQSGQTQSGQMQTGQMGGQMQPGHMGYPIPFGPMGGQQITPGAPGSIGLVGTSGAPGAYMPGMLPIEASYIENILRLNRGKLATVYMTFEGSSEWNSMIFKGIVEAAGRDHLIISDPQTGKRYLLLMVYLDYVTFDEELEYEYPFGSTAGLAVYPPR